MTKLRLPGTNKVYDANLLIIKPCGLFAGLNFNEIQNWKKAGQLVILKDVWHHKPLICNIFN